MKLEVLLEGVEYSVLCGTLDKAVKSLSYHSDKADAGTVFFALCGEQNDGHDYIEALIKEGVEVFVTEEYNKKTEGLREKYADSESLTILTVKNSRQALALASSKFFGEPDKELITVGITGTKGKTATAYMLQAILENAGIKTGIIGTVRQGFEGHYREAENTTPQSYELYRAMREMLDGGCKAVVMEVSSQALMQHRTYGIEFDIAVFTNLSKDHIGKGEHGSMEEYIYWKSRLFMQSKLAVVNGDSPYADDMLKDAIKEKGASEFKVVRFGSEDIAGLMPFRRGQRLGMSFCYRGMEAELGLPGAFSVYNAMAAMCAAEQLGIEPRDMLPVLRDIKISGRTEQIPTEGKFTVLLDYAHNGDSMRRLLTALRAYEPASLVALFGCGGNRDRSRRYEMGSAAAELADFSVITSDNPREEPPEDIIADIVRAVAAEGGTCTVIPDRRRAIEQTLSAAKRGDIIVICGKGHETYQIIGNEKIRFDDREVILSVTETRETEK